MTLSEARKQAKDEAILYKQSCLIYKRASLYYTVCECVITRQECEAAGLEYLETVDFTEEESP
jgi:hypothetical protein